MDLFPASRRTQSPHKQTASRDLKPISHPMIALENNIYIYALFGLSN